MRAQGLLTDAGWFVRCEGEADLARLKEIGRMEGATAKEAT
jgi:hypothetical protein